MEPEAGGRENTEPGDLVADISGEYRVASAGDGDVDLPHGIIASIDGSSIRVESDCLRFAWSYRFDGARLITETAPVPSCRRALLPVEEAVVAAFDGADSVRRTPANGLEFAGGGGTVTVSGNNFARSWRPGGIVVLILSQ